MHFLCQKKKERVSPRMAVGTKGSAHVPQIRGGVGEGKKVGSKSTKEKQKDTSEGQQIEFWQQDTDIFLINV